jgi:hypothetical protein
MASDVVVGINSFASLTYVNAYLGDSARAAAEWALFTEQEKARFIITATRTINKQAMLGRPTNPLGLATIVVSVAGAGYTQNEFITITGDSRDVVVEVLTVGSSGEILTARLTDAGIFAIDPASPLSQASSTGSGTGAQFTFTTSNSTLSHPRTNLRDCEDNQVDVNAFAPGIQEATAELAFEISQSTDAETQAGVGNNTKRVRAGSAEVEFFRPSAGPEGVGSRRFTTVVFEYLRCYLDGARGATGPQAFGTTGTTQSEFTDTSQVRDGLA